MRHFLVDEINRALRARGWSARQASVEAVGSPELIRDMRRGRLPSVERLHALCEVLDLEFYIGPRRVPGTLDRQRLERAVERTECTLQASARGIEPQAKAEAIVAVYELLDREQAPETAGRVERLINALTSARGPERDGPRREPRGLGRG